MFFFPALPAPFLGLTHSQRLGLGVIASLFHEVQDILVYRKIFLVVNFTD